VDILIGGSNDYIKGLKNVEKKFLLEANVMKEIYLSIDF